MNVYYYKLASSVPGDGGESNIEQRPNNFTLPKNKDDLPDGHAAVVLPCIPREHGEMSSAVVSGTSIPPLVTHNAMQVALGSFDDEILCTQRRRALSDSGGPSIGRYPCSIVKVKHYHPVQ